MDAAECERELARVDQRLTHLERADAARCEVSTDLDRRIQRIEALVLQIRAVVVVLICVVVVLKFGFSEAIKILLG